MAKDHCRGLLPHMTDFLEGDAGETVCERIRRHLIGCEKCRMYVDTQNRLVELYKRWRDEDIPRVVEVRLKERLRRVMDDDFRGETKRPPRRRTRRGKSKR